MDRKQDSSFCCIQEIYLNLKDRHHLRVKGWKKIFQSIGFKKQACVSIVTSNKTDFKPKLKEMEKDISKKKSTTMTGVGSPSV